MASKNNLLAAAVCAASAAWVIYAATPKEFVPDSSFKGSDLKGWHALGAATWKAQSGEITGTAAAGSGGGWLVLDKPYQDIQLSSEFRCADPCKTGLLLRASKTPEGGLQGIFASLTTGDLALYSLTLDPQGHELKREKLAPAPAAGGGAAPGGGRGGGGGGGGRGRGARPVGLRDADWNEVEIIVAADALRAVLNGSPITGGGAGAAKEGFGPIALYAGDAGSVTFRDVAWKDLNSHIDPKDRVSAHFSIQRISDFDYAAGAAVADVNHDGIPDIVAGPYYYPGPEFTERREYRAGRMYNPSIEYAPDMITFAYDFTGDGWPDILSSNFDTLRPMDLYVNPKGEPRRWDKFRVLPDITTELVLMKDIDGDGKPEIIYGTANGYVYAKPKPDDPTAPWIETHISEGARSNNHGMGVGDINGDGRMDLVTPAGWYEQPPKGATGPWPFHAMSFGSGAAEMGIYDVNGDGLNDVVTGLAAHDWGLAWFEQKRDKDGAISFVQHHIMGDYSTKNAGDVAFSEPHGAAFADIDGDGIPDFITGKKRWSHLENYNGPDPYGPAVLYVYRTVRNPKAEGGAEFVPELIHNRSGVGSAFAVADLNNDGAPDIVTSADLGTFVFLNKPGSWNTKKAAPAKSK